MNVEARREEARKRHEQMQLRKQWFTAKHRLYAETTHWSFRFHNSTEVLVRGKKSWQHSSTREWSWEIKEGKVKGKNGYRILEDAINQKIDEIRKEYPSFFYWVCLIPNLDAAYDIEKTILKARRLLRKNEDTDEAKEMLSEARKLLDEGPDIGPKATKLYYTSLESLKEEHGLDK